MPNNNDLFYRNVGNSYITVKRGAYLDSGPIGLSHADTSLLSNTVQF